jgi:hypothetical protein
MVEFHLVCERERERVPRRKGQREEEREVEGERSDEPA